ncbi:MFS transporter [Actinoallomurus purpureus]|uniref:MFS transporter n=1 Tax=Actinoallomurus purpureus TaxID=478114 RepID=UPI0020937BF4|nr:MFS transporter [Actinoallomurus purpureus]MCO6009556.1 MFS transporter [Actinoallomurus purpureus]
MYVSAGLGNAARAMRVWRLVAPNIVALGAVSLVTDVSSEMITAVLPLYLVLSLGLTPLQFGVLDGMYAGVTALIRLVGGRLADRSQRHRLVAGLGYALSAACKLGLLVAGSSPVALGAVLAADRTGKGLRTAPRDALIAASSAPRDLGLSFGVHRTMDTAGALAGPLAAFAVLWAAPGAYDAVFVVSCCVAVFGVVLLVAFVRDPPIRALPRAAMSLRPLGRPGFALMCLAAALLGACTISDSFVYLLLQRRLGIAAGYFPLLPLGTAASFLTLAVPFGRLADRAGRRAVFIGGHVLLLGAYLLLRGPLAGAVLLTCVLTLHGAFYAATDGVLMAAAGPLLPGPVRASGMAVLQTAQALARLVSSVLIGAAWTAWGRPAAVTAATAGLGVAIVAAWPLLRAAR